MNNEQEQNIFDSNLSPGAQKQIEQISKWARVISSIGFGIGAFIVFSMIISGAEVMKTVAASLPIQVEGIYGALILTFFIFFFVIAALLYFLHKGATLLRQAVQQKNNALLAEGFNFIKRFFIVMIVLGLISLAGNIITLF